MIYSNLGNTDQKEQNMLRHNDLYEQNTEEEAHEQLNFAIENGVNFIDTAEMHRSSK